MENEFDIIREALNTQAAWATRHSAMPRPDAALAALDRLQERITQEVCDCDNSWEDRDSGFYRYCGKKMPTEQENI